jgi:hypothetical protein
MVNGNYFSGGPGLMHSMIRSIFLVLAAIGGFFLFAASAAFAVIVTGGLIIFGVVIFVALWLRAKILGKPLNPYAKMYTAEVFKARSEQKQAQDIDGPVLDAHETPDGWSVDDD